MTRFVSKRVNCRNSGFTREEMETMILDYVGWNPSCTMRSIVRSIGSNTNAMKVALELVREGKLERERYRASPGDRRGLRKNVWIYKVVIE